MPTAREATAADFDRASQRHADAFWGWIVTAGVVWWLASLWWAAIPAAFAALRAVKSVGCTRCADQLRKGTYRIPNPNNGAPDGDASNY